MHPESCRLQFPTSRISATAREKRSHEKTRGSAVETTPRYILELFARRHHRVFTLCLVSDKILLGTTKFQLHTRHSLVHIALVPSENPTPHRHHSCRRPHSNSPAAEQRKSSTITATTIIATLNGGLPYVPSTKQRASSPPTPPNYHHPTTNTNRLILVSETTIVLRIKTARFHTDASVARAQQQQQPCFIPRPSSRRPVRSRECGSVLISSASSQKPIFFNPILKPRSAQLSDRTRHPWHCG